MDATTIDARPPLDAATSDAVTGDVGTDGGHLDDAGTDTNCAALAYYVDCDRDGFAALGATVVIGCSVPAAPPCSGGTWTTTAPTPGAIDCADDQMFAFPGSVAVSTMPAWVSGGVRHFDWNCDGMDTPQYVAHGLGPVEYCGVNPDPPGFTCDLPPDAVPNGNWVGAVPACGVTAAYNGCPDSAPTSGGCRPMVVNATQACN